jgi:hypothetical protein
VTPEEGPASGGHAAAYGTLSALQQLGDELRGEGGLIAAAIEPRPPSVDGAGTASDMAVLVEAIREGQLLHAGRPRLVTGADEDLALLAGDRLYALGLERLAALGDLDAVIVLADLISACARAQAEGRPELAEEAWNVASKRLGEDVAR